MEAPKTILSFLQFDNPTAEQKTALEAMEHFVSEENKNDFMILCGAAGTGKTSITTALIGFLNHEKVNYEIAAPTGRAARILGRKANTNNSTIHSMVFDVRSNSKTGEVYYNPKTSLNKNRMVFIIDEASMVGSLIENDSNSLFKTSVSLLDAIVLFCKSGNSKNKVIFLGDRNQLSPINEKESLALNKDYLHQKYSWNGEQYMLNEVKRQVDGSYILKNATNIRACIDHNINDYQLQKVFDFGGYGGATTSYVKTYNQYGPDFAISIACSHKQNQMFNSIVREKLYGKHTPLLLKGDYMLVTRKWTRNGITLYSGDHVKIEEVNLMAVEDVAGLRFVAVKLRFKTIKDEDAYLEDYLLLDSLSYPTGSLSTAQEGKLRNERYAKNKVYRDSGNQEDDRYIGALRLAYGHSITCNKAQGGEWQKVYINKTGIPSLRYKYTAITRAKETLLSY